MPTTTARRGLLTDTACVLVAGLSPPDGRATDAPLKGW
ncbi:hypothetical protein FRUB_06158 [Fimbriiglobus ruber]|uniref:Uncharacterized protein n=1 Tax=Fimbriiglobus ruber TaxID=1908690 RepID=A0A225DNM4_9BACT|nr:hypothetical protein FRUB_06158 [Fimbriiglobus ruber]